MTSNTADSHLMATHTQSRFQTVGSKDNNIDITPLVNDTQVVVTGVLAILYLLKCTFHDETV